MAPLRRQQQRCYSYRTEHSLLVVLLSSTISFHLTIRTLEATDLQPTVRIWVQQSATSHDTDEACDQVLGNLTGYPNSAKFSTTQNRFTLQFLVQW
jgi:hypothetical protein